MGSRNVSLNLQPGVWAPVHTPKWRHNPVRLARQPVLAQIPDGMPLFIPLFDTTSLFAAATPANVLGPLQTYENDFQITSDFWWLCTMASFSVGSVANPPFVWQLYSVVDDGKGNQQSQLYQKTPVTAETSFGTAQKPFELQEPVYLAAGTELICSVQNLQNANLALQLVLMGYLTGEN
jgi:hypothetical protein